MRETADAREARLATGQGLVDLVGVRLDRAGKPRKATAHRLETAVAIELEEDIAARHGVEPQVAARRLALHVGVEHAHGRLVDLQVAGGAHLGPHGVGDRAEPVGEVLDPLHHLLAGDAHLVALADLLLEAIEREMVVVARQQDVDGQAQPEGTLGNQARRERGDGDAGRARLGSPQSRTSIGLEVIPRWGRPSAETAPSHRVAARIVTTERPAPRREPPLPVRV